MKAFVTGATGFIGSQVVRQLLAAGHSIRIFSRSADIPLTLRDRVEVVIGNLEKPSSLVDALDDCDVLFHIGEIRNTTKAAAESNVRLLDEIIRRLRGRTAMRIVFVSSISVAGIPSTIPANEETVPAKELTDQYTTCKRECEKLLVSNAGDLEYAIIRPAPVYGPGSRYLSGITGVIERLGPFGIPFAGDGRNLAPLIHVSDLASAICLAGSVPAAAGQTFNMTDGLRHTWADFFHGIADGLGTKLRIIPLPPLMLQLAAFPLDLVSGLLGVMIDPVSFVSYFSRDLFFDNTKTREMLGWQARYSLHEGIGEMIEFYRQNKSE